MNDNRKIEESIERAIEIMESPETISEEALRTLLDDKECRMACRAAMESSRLLMSEMPAYKTDVDREWEKFLHRHQTESRRRWWIGGLTVGIAAMLALLVFFSWSFISSRTAEGPVTVFLADNDPQQVTLQMEDGKLIALDEAQMEELSAMGVMLQKKEIDYQAAESQTAEVKMHTLSTPRGTDFRVVLSDGTEVWLNAESRLEYPASFVGKERMVTLRGEAYFKVAKDEKHPFIIKTDDLTTRVLGTEFNVRNYSVTDSHVTLIQGSVEVRNNKGGDYVRIAPGEDACLQADGSFVKTEVDVDSYIYWKEGYFYFDNISLVDIMQNLGRWYNVTILFKNKEAMNYKMHFLTDRKAGLEHAVMLLNRMKKVNITLKDGTLIVG